MNILHYHLHYLHIKVFLAQCHLSQWINYRDKHTYSYREYGCIVPIQSNVFYTFPHTDDITQIYFMTISRRCEIYFWSTLTSPSLVLTIAPVGTPIRLWMAPEKFFFPQPSCHFYLLLMIIYSWDNIKGSIIKLGCWALSVAATATAKVLCERSISSLLHYLFQPEAFSRLAGCLLGKLPKREYVPMFRTDLVSNRSI